MATIGYIHIYKKVKQQQRLAWQQAVKLAGGKIPSGRDALSAWILRKPANPIILMLT
ncbi:hypothetical protein F7734_06940 [Scytonema sp. UIC 10036]|uniref:hypothetical protein n=1 Tax=Scytonema sp. UIC 10036 TaxID=2304196 RepID=UPI0012DAE111|nr:hypothetical protein [Scytonema sp. UIC 10036]MUG92208.1 hypothetical protein [Scytonema sp. UIC 10036]